MKQERDDDLRAQADSLAVQMASIHYQKAERRTKVLETCRAMLTLHSLLTQQLKERKHLERRDMAQSIQNHCLVGRMYVALHGWRAALILEHIRYLTFAAGPRGSGATVSEGKDRVGRPANVAAQCEVK